MTELDVAWERYDCALAEPFGIARGTTETVPVFLLEVARGELVGLGAGTPSEYYGETPAATADALDRCREALEAVGDPHHQRAIARRCREVAPDAPAARSAVSTAVADLAARDLGVPLYRQLGLDPAAAPPTSYTVGIDEPDAMADRAAAAVERGFDVLKVKLGTEDDRARFDAIQRAAPDATLRVDANCAWDAETAIQRAAWLADAGVQFLEQPVPADDVAALREVRAAADLPICADEACVDAADVPAVAEACDLVTVKLAKCGGLRPAVRQIHAADAHGLDAMLGCMVESNASIAPAWHLAPLVEHVDLDGALLLGEDPCEGVPIADGRADLGSVAAGTGARRSG